MAVICKGTLAMTAAVDFEFVKRAGFWPRLVAHIIDQAVVLLPLQLIIAVLFALTGGFVQGDDGFSFRSCYSNVSAESFESECSSSFFGMRTAHVRRLGAIDKGEHSPAVTPQTLMIGAGGGEIDGIDIGWLGAVFATIYLITLEWRNGVTFGKRVVGLRVVDANSPSSAGIPLKKAIIRNFAIFCGLIPLIVVGIIFLLLIFVFHVPLLGYLWLLGLAGFLYFCWIVTLVVQIVMKIDPYYDRIAGTAVIWD